MSSVFVFMTPAVRVATRLECRKHTACANESDVLNFLSQRGIFFLIFIFFHANLLDSLPEVVYTPGD